MRGVIEAALESARLAGAIYADVRIVDSQHQEISVASGRLEGVVSGSSLGIGVRAIADGHWGFAATYDVSTGSAAGVAKQAVAIARASALVPSPALVLADVSPVEDSWRGPWDIDPFAVSIEDKLAVLLAADEEMRNTSPRVTLTKAELGFHKYRKMFGSSLGSFIEQEWIESGAGITAYALGDGEVVPRSYPNSHRGAWMQAGWEFVLALDLVGNAARVADQAAAILSAPDIEPGEIDLIIDGSQVALQVHESIGHPTELDRVLGDEAAFAGTSFLGLKDLGSLKYGSEFVTVTADATIPGPSARSDTTTRACRLSEATSCATGSSKAS